VRECAGKRLLAAGCGRRPRGGRRAQELPTATRPRRGILEDAVVMP